MIHIGIDPGINFAGVVAILDGKVLHEDLVVNSSDEPKGKRLSFDRLDNQVTNILLQVWKCAPEDTKVAIEEPFVGPNGGTALKTYAVFICVAMSLRADGYRVHAVPAPALKKYLGVTQKNFVARQVYKRWKYEAADDNLVDAYAIAQWCREQA